MIILLKGWEEKVVKPQIEMENDLKSSKHHASITVPNFQKLISKVFFQEDLGVISWRFTYLRKGFPSLQHCLCLHSDPLCAHSLQRSPHHTRWSLACRLALQCATNEVLGECTTAYMVKMNNKTHHMHDALQKQARCPWPIYYNKPRAYRSTLWDL